MLMNFAYLDQTDSAYNLYQDSYTIFNNCYDKIFIELRDKLFILSDSNETFELLDSEKEEYTQKYDLTNINEGLSTFKKCITDMYIRKKDIDQRYTLAKEKYCNFNKNIVETIKSINLISTAETEADFFFKEILTERINWYYSELKLDSLKQEHYQINGEFFFLKKMLTELSEISNPTVCQICFENQISYIIDPCGHTMCENCKIKSLNLQNCHFCRTRFGSFKRLYL